MEAAGTARTILEKRLPDMIVRGAAVVRRADGTIKVDAGVDRSRFSDSIQHELREQEEGVQ